MRISKFVESTEDGEIPENGSFIQIMSPISIIGRLSVVVIGKMYLETTLVPPGRYDISFQVAVEVSGEDIFIEHITQPPRSYQKGETLPAPPEYREEGFALFMDYAARLGLLKPKTEDVEDGDQYPDDEDNDFDDEYDALEIDPVRIPEDHQVVENKESVKPSEPAQLEREPDNGASSDDVQASEDENATADSSESK